MSLTKIILKNDLLRLKRNTKTLKLLKLSQAVSKIRKFRFQKKILPFLHKTYQKDKNFKINKNNIQTLLEKKKKKTFLQ